MTRDEAIALHRDELEPTSRPAIRIRAEGPPTGRSRFGGAEALLPPGTPWPTLTEPNTEPPEHQGPLCLLAQIDLAEVRAAVPELSGELPSGGLLQVFMTREAPYSDRDDFPGADSNPRVHFWPEGTPLMPVPGPGVPREARGLSFALWPTFHYHALIELDDDAQDALLYPEPHIHQMLGHSLPVQDTPEAESAGSVPILVLASEDDLEWYFHDVGTLYFHAEPGAWRRGKLEGLTFEAQSH